MVCHRLHDSPKVCDSGNTAQYLDALAGRFAGEADAAPVRCIFDNTAIGAATADSLSVLGKLHGTEGTQG